jgi:NAD-dependent dihydropyrimidine dehydrogenase PreA subunit
VTYVIAEPCIDVKDRACVDECPVDCIYEGERSLYIQPDECIDCGACEPVCPVQAIFYEDDLPPEWAPYQADNARFFAERLPGQDEPVGSPGGAAKVGPIPADTPLVAAFPGRPS